MVGPTIRDSKMALTLTATIFRDEKKKALQTNKPF